MAPTEFDSVSQVGQQMQNYETDYGNSPQNDYAHGSQRLDSQHLINTQRQSHSATDGLK